MPVWAVHRSPFFIRPWLLTIVAALIAASANAQQKTLSIDALFDPDARVDFTGNVPATQWIDDTTLLITTSAQDTVREMVRLNVATGATEPFHDAAKLEAALTSVAGLGPEEAKRVARPKEFTFNPARTAAVLTALDDLYTYEFATGQLTRLTNDPAREQNPTFSPDGRRIAFTRANNLFVVDLATDQERQLTTDGSSVVLNGRLDWVYQEEIYGRGKYRAFWWSPDGSRLAFLQLNERQVPAYTIVDHIPRRPELEVYPYPKAGDPNPTARVGIVRAVGGPVAWIDTFKYSAADHLVVSVSWTPDSRSVVCQVQDREQTWLDVNLANPLTGDSKTLFRETTSAWVYKNGDPVWLEDGTFLWLSERTGWQHVYHYSRDGALIRQVTQGDWEVRDLYGVDQRSGWVYFAGSERSPIGDDLYRIRLDGSGLTRLSAPEGTHAATFNPSFTSYVGTWSDVVTPTQTWVHKADGSPIRVIAENRIPSLADYRIVKPEFVHVKTRDGFTMEAMVIRPPDFDPARKYPVLQQTYAGPHAQTVRNAWGGANAMYNQLLAQHGIIVWACDNRSASAKGAQSIWPAYQRLGETELADIEDGLAWLKQQPGVDGSRIGISGWSYGGFMASYALTHSRSFAMGIAGAPVTDWAQYDSIYTERYMRLPQNNPDGYRKSSVVGAAKDLSGRLLLVHGTVDDNVHLQNTLQFAYALQKAGKQFELMLYPRSQHGVSDKSLVKHMRAMMLDFVLRTLQPASTSQVTAASR